jgi:hypothetical protein
VKKTKAIALCAAGSVYLLCSTAVSAGDPPKTRAAVAASGVDAPAYTSDNGMKLPADYREWVYLSTGFDMSYRPNSQPDHHMFDSVFVNPSAYREFLKAGTWPDKTVLVLEVRGARDKGSINQSGHYQGTDIMGLEVHVKDEARFPGSWAFFVFEGKSLGTLLPTTAECYSCHAAHAAVDTTFVQFYPTLLPVATAKGTLSPAYQAEQAAHASSAVPPRTDARVANSP